MKKESVSKSTHGRKKKKPSSVHNTLPKVIVSRWQQLIDKLEYAPNEFYQALQEKFTRRQIPELVMGKVTFKQKGTFSRRRIYLRLIRNEFIFDICASPMGNDAFFISYWHGFLRYQGVEGIIKRIGLVTPIIGYFLERDLNPETYHHADSYEMFQQLVHNVIMETIDEITKEASLPALTDEQRKPVEKDLLNI